MSELPGRGLERVWGKPRLWGAVPRSVGLVSPLSLALAALATTAAVVGVEPPVPTPGPSLSVEATTRPGVEPSTRPMDDLPVEGRREPTGAGVGDAAHGEPGPEGSAAEAFRASRSPTRIGVRPVPADGPVGTARAALHERYRRDFADVTPAGKRRLAGRLLRDAATEAGDAALWVALSEARELAASCGEADTAIAAACELGRRFDIDADAMLVSVLQQLARQRLSAGAAAGAVRTGSTLVEVMLARDDFELAARVAGLCERMAGQSGDAALSVETAQLADFCRDVVRRAAGFRRAVERLRENPDDVSANQTAGEFLVLVKREWGRGLLMLSRGNDPRLKRAAAAELSGERGEGLLSAADAWRVWAGGQRGPQRDVALEHAYRLYRRSADDLAGDALMRCRSAAGEVVLGLRGRELADVSAARARLGDARWAWWSSLQVGELSVRSDAGELVNTQALLAWRPAVPEGEELPPPPEGDGSRGEAPVHKGARLTYLLKLLCVDERGEPTVLSEEGRVTWRATDKPLRLPGPRNAAVRRVNAGKAVPHAAWVEVRLDGVAVAERYWRLPEKRAWWLGS